MGLWFQQPQYTVKKMIPNMATYPSTSFANMTEDVNHK